MKADYRVQEDVVEELAADPSLDASGVGVAVKSGIVTPSGTVPSYAAKLAAEQAGGRVAGVRAVALELTIDVPIAHVRTDADIAGTIVQSLADDVTLPPGRIKVVVEKGCVTLSGEVDRMYQKENAHRDLAHQPGIRSVQNLITVKPSLSTGDVEQSVRRALRRQAQSDADDIAIEVHGDLVILHGPVRSLTESRTITRSAFDVPGVSQVKNLTYISD